jgi:hypothetical protein
MEHERTMTLSDKYAGNALQHTACRRERSDLVRSRRECVLQDNHLEAVTYHCARVASVLFTLVYQFEEILNSV